MLRLLQCSSALSVYRGAALFGTVATSPPRRTTPADSAVELEKSITALPAVEAESSVSVAPVKEVLTVTPVMLSRAELYCRVNLPAVTPEPLFRFSGMPKVRLLGRLIVAALLGPRAKPGMPTTSVGVEATTKVVV